MFFGRGRLELHGEDKPESIRLLFIMGLNNSSFVRTPREEALPNQLTDWFRFVFDDFAGMATSTLLFLFTPRIFGVSV